MRRLTVLCGCMVTSAFAEVFEFNQIPMPANLSLKSYYVFHVYADEKRNVTNQSTGRTEPLILKPSNETAQVTFKNFEVKWSNGKVGIGDYKSLQVSLIPLSQFWDALDRTDFCTAERKVIFKAGGPSISLFTVGSNETTVPITSTGEYLLTVTNCGDHFGTITKGEVIVNQVHGYLPGNKMGTLQWWGWFCIVNALLCIFWAVALARHCTSLLYIHKMLAAIAMTALLEAVAAYVQFKDWNYTGTQSMGFLVATMFFYSIKYLLSLRMVVNAGSGVTTGKIELLDEFKLDINCVGFLLQQWTWKAFLSGKERLMINPMFSMACTIPSSLLWMLLFVWVYRKFQAMLSVLKDRRPASEAVRLLTNTQSVLLASVLLATVVLLLQFADIMLSRTPWNLQWVPYDAAPHSVYTLFLLALMILWFPRGDTWKLGYLDQVNLDENVGGGTGKVDPEQIGLAEEQEE